MYPNLPNKPKDAVVDFDDHQMTLNNGRVGDLSLAYLFYLKHLFPKFKATLFAIPARCSPHILKEINKLGWIELAVHGWEHNDNYECSKWTKEECLMNLSKVETQFGDIFVKGFKAPGWQISDGCYEALLQAGYWVADHVYNDNRRPKELPVYKLDHPWCIHGHTWDIQGVPLDQQNGIRQMIEERGLCEKLTQETNFHFISEIIGKEVNAQDIRNPVDTPIVHQEEPRNPVEVQRQGNDTRDRGGSIAPWNL